MVGHWPRQVRLPCRQTLVKLVTFQASMVKQCCEFSPRFAQSYSISTYTISRSTMSISTPAQIPSASKDKSAGGTPANFSVAQMNPTGGIPTRGLAGSNDAKPVSSTGGQIAKSLSITEGSTEERLIKDRTNTDSQAGPSESTHQQHQTRPGGAEGVGSQGKIVFLSTNYFQLTVQPGRKLYRYSVSVWPESKGGKLVQMISDALLLPEFNNLRPGMVSDFAAVLLSQQILPDDLLKVSVPYKKNTSTEDTTNTERSGDAEDPSDAETPSRYYVVFDFVRVVDFVNETNLGETSADQGNLAIVQDLDIVLGHHRKISSNVSMIGKRRAFQMENPKGDTIFL